MANHGHDRQTGRFVSKATRRVQSLQRLADISEDEWYFDEQVLSILEGGIAKAIEDGWVPPPEVELEPQP